MGDAAMGRGVARERSPEQVLAQMAALPAGTRWQGILTGGRGAGKSTWCFTLAEAARSRGFSVAGVLSRAIFANDSFPPAERKVRIDLVDLTTGDARTLATPGDPDAEGHGMRWHFHNETIAWGNAALEAAGAATSGSHRGAADLLIIDELGPLELTHGRGLTAGLALLDERGYSFAVVVIRPELVPQAQQRWPDAEVFTVPAWG